MIIIKKETKRGSHLRKVTSEDMFLEEKVIDGKVYYMPIQLPDSEEICSNEYANVELEKCPDCIYAKFSNYEGKVKAIVNIETKSKQDAAYDSMEMQVLAGRTYIKDIDCLGKIKQVYVSKEGRFYPEASVMTTPTYHLELCEFLGAVYVELVDEVGKEKKMTTLGKGRYDDPETSIMTICAPYKVQKFKNKPYVIKIVRGNAVEVISLLNKCKRFKSSFYDEDEEILIEAEAGTAFETNSIHKKFPGCLKFLDGYVMDVDENGVCRRAYDVETDEELFPYYELPSKEYGYIEFCNKEGYAKYLDKNGVLVMAYDFETKEIRKLDVYGRITLSHHVIFK